MRLLEQEVAQLTACLQQSNFSNEDYEAVLRRTPGPAAATLLREALEGVSPALSEAAVAEVYSFSFLHLL